MNISVLHAGNRMMHYKNCPTHPLVDCPECGQPELKKKISAAGFRLTGGGWYETDFKTGDKKKNLSGDSQSSGADKPAASDKASEPKKPASSKTESAA
jgi:predicted nucleic acid-binding Zn ribbon protein